MIFKKKDSMERNFLLQLFVLIFHLSFVFVEMQQGDQLQEVKLMVLRSIDYHHQFQVNLLVFLLVNCAIKKIK